MVTQQLFLAGKSQCKNGPRVFGSKLAQGPVGDGEEVTLRLLADHYMTPYAAQCGASCPPSDIRTVTRVTESTESEGKRTSKEGPPQREPLADCVKKATVKVFEDTHGKVLVAFLPDPIDAHATYKFEAVSKIRDLREERAGKTASQCRVLMLTRGHSKHAVASGQKGRVYSEIDESV